MGNAYLVVIDGLGVGAQEDAHYYGDDGSNTLGHVCATTECKLPNFEKLGLGNIIPLDSVPPHEKPAAAYGKMHESSPGKDSTTGHWEIAGIKLEHPFPTYNQGFPREVINKFCEGIGVDEVLCNNPYSGTEVIKDYGEQHLDTKKPIVYTSADSVFQVACHVDITPVDKLYDWCEFARKNVMVGEHGVGRVIARPFEGEPGNFRRISEKRHDFSIEPPENNLVNVLLNAGIKTYAIGKIVDLFANIPFTQYRRTRSNAEGISQLLSIMEAVENSFVFVNLIDTDQVYGHRLDTFGYSECLQEIDRAIPAIIGKLEEDDILILTSDHGNDPTTGSTDHAREFTPLLFYPDHKASSINLCTRSTFSDIGKTIVDYFKVENDLNGQSFLNQSRS